jgi:hypothetical protein
VRLALGAEVTCFVTSFTKYNFAGGFTIQQIFLLLLSFFGEKFFE